jgi:hypothetical protein
MKWLRGCFAEYARHPGPGFIGLAIIAASLVTAAMASIRRHAGSEPSAPLAGSGQSAQPAALLFPRPAAVTIVGSPSSAMLVPAAQPEAAPSRRPRNTRGPVTARTFDRGNTGSPRILTAGRTTARAIRPAWEAVTRSGPASGAKADPASWRRPVSRMKRAAAVGCVLAVSSP